MTPYTKRGLPRRLANDAWWLAAPADVRTGPEPKAAPKPTPPYMRRLTSPMLGGIALIAAMDIALWNGPGVLPFAVLMAVLVAVLARVMTLDRKTILRMGIVATLACLPLIAFWQALSVLWYFIGMLAVLGLAINIQATQLWSLFWRLPWAGLMGMGQEISAPRTTPKGQAGQFLRDWGLALGVGFVFVILFLIANPLLDQVGQTVMNALENFNLNISRITLWIVAAIFATLILSVAFIKVPQARAAHPSKRFTAKSLINALVVFNALFAFQLGSDAWVLLFQGGLPEHVTLAEYAHRGAYPLVATALLAGIFMLLARPHVADARVLKTLLAIWVLQNAALLAFAAYRLSIYVDVFGLTYLRLHAGIWMGLVAVGLGLVGWDLYRPQMPGWIVRWSLRSSAMVLYAACFVNFGAYITTANLDRAAQGKSVDWDYLCNIGVSNHGVLFDVWDDYDVPFPQGALNYRPIQTWRDWDFRRATIDRSITAIRSNPFQVPS